MRQSKNLQWTVFLGVLIFSMGVANLPLAAFAASSSNAPNGESSVPRVEAQEDQEILKTPLKIDSAQMSETIRLVKEKLDAFPRGARAHEKAAIGEIWVVLPSLWGFIKDDEGNSNSNASWSFLNYGHAAIVHCDEKTCGERTIEAYPKNASPIGIDGVHHYENNWKNNPRMMRNNVMLLGVANSSLQKRTGARDFANSYIGTPYGVTDGKTNYNTFYCSKLVWAAWYSQGEDLSRPFSLTVMPADLVSNRNTVLLWRN